jgi:hypothetical protein
MSKTLNESIALEERPMIRKPSAQPSLAWRGLELLASLRLTVVLFVLSLLLVFYGTWAQVDAGIWTVVNEYFRSAYVWIPLNTVLLRIVDVPGSILFPGGWLLGGILLANLLAAHLVRFKLTWKRSGILLIHSGLVVMMLGELVTGLFAIEGRMTIPEGLASNWVDHDRNYELAVVRPSRDTNHEVLVPHEMLRQGEVIRDDRLPFDVKVVSYMTNSDIKGWAPGSAIANPATAGIGLGAVAVERPEISGVDTSQQIDIHSAYVELLDKKTQQSLGIYLVSTWHAIMYRPADEVEVDGVKYAIQLRPKRSYRDYSIFLKQFRHDKFTGTETPKNYQSDVILTDPETNERREVKIWMNHPLRYRGETFYQSSLHPLTKGTVLQVVRNPGWLMPYFACAMVSIGMLIHFGMHLTEFLRRRMAV